ncbi:MAG: ABC transporter ATP-binding protein [Rhodoferax sp.]
MLAIEQLHAGYGQSQVLHGVTLAIASGEIVALLGRNGAGRSTLARAVMGLLSAQGRIQWRGHSILGKKTFEIARLGLGYVPESRDVFPDLTVAQNLLLGHKNRTEPGHWSLAQVYRLFPQLAARAAVRAGVLSGGEQQMLTLCRTLIGEPELVIIDEPTEGLAPQLVEAVAGLMRLLKTQGTSVLLIEQKLTMALDVADRCAVMGHGRIVFDGTPAALRQDSALRQEWLQV